MSHLEYLQSQINDIQILYSTLEIEQIHIELVKVLWYTQTHESFDKDVQEAFDIDFDHPLVYWPFLATLREYADRTHVFEQDLEICRILWDTRRELYDILQWIKQDGQELYMRFQRQIQ